MCLTFAPRALALAAGIAVLPFAAQAETVLTLGVYLWADSDSEPVRAQYMSIASGVAETETDGPAGYKSASRPVTADETRLMEAAIRDRMAALTLDASPKIAPPFVTVEWHFSHETGYAEGIGTYKLSEIPTAVLTFQKAAFGATYENMPTTTPDKATGTAPQTDPETAPDTAPETAPAN